MYYLIFCITYLLSLVPLQLLYVISDFLYFLLYYIIGYRKEVVYKNLAQAFPELSANERTKIAKKFYRNLTDLMIEIIKMMSMSRRQIKKRFKCDPTIFKKLELEKRSCQIQLGHFFNWEWANLYIQIVIDQPLLITYMPLHNKAFDKLFKYIRSRFGSVLISAKNTLEEMAPWKEKPFTGVLVADQNPGNVRRAYWFPFMNKMTSFYKGPELSARRSDHAVVFGNIKKVKRGYYKIETQLAFEHPAEEATGEVTRAFVAFLEKCIREQPENWLWSHRRWKREWQGQKNT